MPPRTREQARRTFKSSSRPSRPSGGGGPPGRGSTAPSRAAVESAQRANRAAKERQKEREKEQQQKENLLQKAQNVVMRKGEHVSDPASLTKKSWEAAGKVPTGQHKLRSQYDRLAAKYGPGWEKTSQAQDLANYLSGVPVSRGGGMGARDPEYGGLTSWDQLDPTSEAYRQQLLEEMSTRAGRPGGGGIAGLKGIDLARARGNLTPDQYFNFRQQLMQADPASYRQAFPFASGNLLQGVASLAPGLGMAGRILKGALGKAQNIGQGVAQAIPRGLLSLFNRGQGTAAPAVSDQQGKVRNVQYEDVWMDDKSDFWRMMYDRMTKEEGMTADQAKRRMGEIARSSNFVGTYEWIPDEFNVPFPGYEQNQVQGVIGGMNQPVGQGQMAPSAITPGRALEMSPITHQLRFQQPNPNWEQWYQNIGRFS